MTRPFEEVWKTQGDCFEGQVLFYLYKFVSLDLKTVSVQTLHFSSMELRRTRILEENCEFYSETKGLCAGGKVIVCSFQKHLVSWTRGGNVVTHSKDGRQDLGSFERMVTVRKSLFFPKEIVWF